VLIARAQDRPTIPSSIGEERRTNLFLRAAEAEELAALRHSKNDWSD
jgi:hydroxyacylglutathione hydrolase